MKGANRMEATSVDVKRQSASQWLLTWAQPQKGLYLQSILLAVGNVLLKILPYFLIADVVGMFLNEEKDFAAYGVKAALIALSFLGAELCHSLSTSLSHQATFSVLASVRKAYCDKLARVPLGYVKDTPSGTFKNIIVERIDSMETTLAHIVPEFTANLLAPVRHLPRRDDDPDPLHLADGATLGRSLCGRQHPAPFQLYPVRHSFPWALWVP